ncbi:UDP-glycosyltransferase 73B3 [Abeliophyllum distichum]|uniref:UDP-glycosyltransferase 73B3 n=1 Tax=Abeliophyllum distichum TaxID=126358 RepID=A0ABD1TH80_9LAMI
MSQLHVFFFPLMAHGHMIPTLEMAKLFTSRGVQTSIIATPGFVKPIENARNSGFNIGIHLMKFPPEKSELPDGITSLDQIISDDMILKFTKSLELLQEPVEKLLEEFRPDCLVADMFFPWATDAAAKFDIPRLVFPRNKLFFFMYFRTHEDL